jgi:hypothetical protein
MIAKGAAHARRQGKKKPAQGAGYIYCPRQIAQLPYLIGRTRREIAGTSFERVKFPLANAAVISCAVLNALERFKVDTSGFSNLSSLEAMKFS